MNKHLVGTMHRFALLNARQFSLLVETTSFGLSELSKDRISRVQMGFVAMDLLVTESTKNTKRGYFGAHTLVGENGDFNPKFLVVGGCTKGNNPVQLRLRLSACYWVKQAGGSRIRDTNSNSSLKNVS
jgi:hypothetical protein